ncbi:MAG: hypothetical protein HY539_01725 [Deltaproteobacteria bacterium]|nr:hypothetical protein [Deltaproteobacteria bacterium]
MANWVKGVIHTVLPNSIGQGVEELEKKVKPHLFDVTDGFYVVEEARKWGVNFIKRSWTDLDELRMRINMRRKVKRHLAAPFQTPDIIDEVTERICEASKDDPRIRRIFG